MSLKGLKLNLMKQFTFVPVSEFSGLQQKAFTPVYTASDGSTKFAYSPGGGDIKGASVFTEGTHEEADQAAAPTNNALFVSSVNFTTITEGGTLTIAAQPDVARNITFTIDNTAAGGALDLADGPDTDFVVGGKETARHFEIGAEGLTGF